jgi:serine/threonine protein kinase
MHWRTCIEILWNRQDQQWTGGALLAELEGFEDQREHALEALDDAQRDECRVRDKQEKLKRRGTPLGPGADDQLQEAKTRTRAARDDAREKEKAYQHRLREYMRLRNHTDGFPELQLPNGVDEQLSVSLNVWTGRTRNMYENVELWKHGRHKIYKASFENMPCVLKRMPDSTGALRRELQMRCRLAHPLIVPIQAAFEKDGDAYLHMPRYPCNLEEWAKDRSQESCVRTCAHVCIALRQMLQVVSHVHARGVIHQDIKPANFLMDTEWQPCLTDFEISSGCARTLGATTIVGIAGTAEYLAPELKYNPDLACMRAADIYALGRTLERVLEWTIELWGPNADPSGDRHSLFC